MTKRILFLQPLAADIAARITARVPEGFSFSFVPSTDPGVLKEHIADADYAVAFGLAVPPEVIQAAPKLRLLHRWGVGVDGVPLETCRELGIAVLRIPGSNAATVADHAVGLMLAALRRIPKADSALRDGRWIKQALWPELSLLTGKTVGLIGYGTIAALVARRVKGFDCEVLYSKRTRLPEAEERALGIGYASVDEILKRSDIVSLHCPLTSETRNLIARPQLEAMKPTALLVNTARGGVANEADLHWALTNGVIGAAGLDVFEKEPTPADNPLLKLDNVVFTPHNAANASDTIEPGVDYWFANIVRHSKGEPLPANDIVIPGTR